MLEKYISPGDTVIVAVSGGPDSTALLYELAEWRAVKGELQIIVAHVNHGIRGKESDRDEKFVRALAQKHGLKFELKRVKLAGFSGQEERGRQIRREFFERLRQKYKARRIITAHTEDDQLETIVFNFLRGSGPAGLAGMKIANGFYLKPLLSMPKAEILAYLKSRKLKFCLDRTNAETRYSRNFIRRRILPLFKKINPNFRKTLLRNAETFRDIQEWLEKEAEVFLGGCFDGLSMTIPSRVFLALPTAVQKTALQMAFQKFTGSSYRLSSVKIDEIRRLLARNIGRKKIQLKKGIWVFLEKGKFRMSP